MKKICDCLWNQNRFQLLRFIIVGSIGFAIDAAILLLAQLVFSVLVSRIISFSVAITCTWLMNRVFTFQSHDPYYRSEWLRYAGVNIVGGSINFFGFIFLTSSFSIFHVHLITALVITSGVAAFFNFVFSKHFAFKTKIIQ